MTTAPPSPATATTGLEAAEAAARLAQDGPNELPGARRRSPWALLWSVLTEPMLLLLVGCGAVYLLLGDRHEAAMLLAFVVVVMLLSFVQQQRSERSLEALRDLSSPRALVLRDGRPQRIAGRELVRGDLVLLAEGDRVPADLWLVDGSSIEVDESLLTGESAPVPKHPQALAGDATPPSPDAAAPAALFAGTLVTRGSGRALVQATGVHSALGRIGSTLAGLGPQRTPIQRETDVLVRRVAVVGLALAAGLALAQALRSGDLLHGLLAGLTLAMAVLPEELPVVLTLFLALGGRRLAREQVLARSVPAIELLGATTVLCVDKTGTLTANRMRLRQLWSPQHAHALAPGAAPVPDGLHELLEYAVLACHRRSFDPMETALVEAGRSGLADTEHLHADWALVDDYPLSPELLTMSRVWRSPDQREQLIAAKGAPEAIVDLCHLAPADGAAIAAQVATMAEQGLRVLGVARARFPAGRLPGHQHDFDFEFLGLVALEDPVRPDVPAAIAECRRAGLRVLMLTGDHPATARSVARQAGLDDSGGVVTGPALAAMDEAALRQCLRRTTVFCRVQPEHKLRLVQALRAEGEVVAMTGDGVNDAPALKAAHIGVAMGARGTDVAREAAALVLVRDDFASLVTAVRHGRRVFANLRKAMAFVVAVHLPIVGLSLLPALLGWPMLLLPVHILCLQLIIDPACALVFEAEPAEPGAMAVPPRAPQARLLDGALLRRALWQGGGLLALLLAAGLGLRAAGLPDDTVRALLYAVLVLASLALIQANRRWHRGAGAGAPNRAFLVIGGSTLALLVLALGVPGARQLFGFAALSAPQVLLAAGLAAAALAWFEAVRRLLQRSPVS